MFALNVSASLIHCGDYDAANAQLDEAVALTDEKGAAALEGRSNRCSKVAYLP